jgi:hypothetical protein
MAGIYPARGRQNNPKLLFCLITPASPGYFSLAVQRFEMTHAPILTALSPDFFGQKWTDGKLSGDRTGGPQPRQGIVANRLKVEARRTYLVERRQLVAVLGRERRMATQVSAVTP